jgi:hypothetical protein
MFWKSKRKRVDDIVGQILSAPRELAFATERDAHQYIADNSDDIDGIIAIARAAAQTLDRERNGYSEARRHIIESAFLSQTNPHGLDRLTRALLHETRISEDAARVLADYFAEHPQKHDWAKSIRDHIVIDIPDAIRHGARNPSMHIDRPFGGVSQVLEALRLQKHKKSEELAENAQSILQPLTPYAERFDPFAPQSGFTALAEQLRQDYPNDLEHAAAALMLFASQARTDTHEDIRAGFERLLGGDDEAIVNRVIEISDSFKIPLPSVLAEGMALRTTQLTEPMVNRFAAYFKSLPSVASPKREELRAAALEFMTTLGYIRPGRDMFLAFLVDMYRQGLLDAISGRTASVAGLALLGNTGAYFMKQDIYGNITKHLFDYLATTDLGKDGDYNPIKTENTVQRILQGTGWIDATISSLDNAESIKDGQQTVDLWLLPALIARPEHTQHVGNQLKQRMDNGKSLQEQTICACAFGHLCERLHEVHPNAEWTIPSRNALERQLQFIRPALLGRARILRNALASRIQDIHQSRTLTDAEYQNIYETLKALDTAIDSIAASAFDPDFDTPSVMRDLRRQLFAEPTGLLKYPSQLWDYQQLNNEQLLKQLCS